MSKITLEFTPYWDDFLRYYQMAKTQQEECNVSDTTPYGMIPHAECSVNDDLMRNVELYDVVERKYAGFSQIVNDCFYGWSDQHPYWKKMEAGKVTEQRKFVANRWTAGRVDHTKYRLDFWLYLMLLHRVTGSAINYSTKPTGYHNTILPELATCKTLEDLVYAVRDCIEKKMPMFTSVGYQFPAFPKPTENYKLGGHYYLIEYAPRLITDLVKFLYADTTIMKSQRKHTFREIGDFMFNWNVENGLRKYKFQYAAFIADIADWFPEFVHTYSPFYYGSNAVQCISYLAKPVRGDKTVFLDAIMREAAKVTGGKPYNIEDVCCDYIRYVENYVRPGADYDHLDLDNLWSTSMIKDHPFGRQKAMLDLGLVLTFNGRTSHPTGDSVIKANNLSIEDYKSKVHA